jgi:hypothetical protein
MKELNIGKEFSKDPAGRYFTDGDGNGEEFREHYLKTRLESLQPNEKLKIILDDEVESYGSSFLVEGFAGMVKYGYMYNDELLRKLEFVFSDNDFGFYRDKIIQYIKEAKYNSKEYIPTK